MQRLFDVLADENRRKILLLLMLGGEQCVCNIYSALNIPQPKASRHLAVMREASLVTVRREGVWMHYRLNPHMPLWVYRILDAMRDGSPAPPTLSCEAECSPSAPMSSKPPARPKTSNKTRTPKETATPDA